MFRISKKVFICSIINIMIIAFTYLIYDSIDDYHISSVIGTIIIFVLVILNIINEKKIISSSNIIFVFFILFQFGWPILNAFDKEYTNWYLTQFTDTNLVSSVWFSVICIEFFSFGLILGNNKNKKIFGKSFALSDENSKKIYILAKLLLFFTSIIAFPIGIYISIQSKLFGYNFTKTLTYGGLSGLVRFAQTMIVPAFLLCFIYSNNKKHNIFYAFVALAYVVVLIATSARTSALALIMVLIIMRNEIVIIDKNKLKKKILIIGGGVIIAYGAVMIAQYRHQGYVNSFSFTSIIFSLIEEMGFNFTTINFVKLFVPLKYDFQYGKMYWNSIICLIPKTIDFTGTITNIYNNLPEIELARWLSETYGNVFDFGVGYSVIAEAYYNFGQLGGICVAIQGLIINYFISDKINENKFQKYIRYIMLYSLITYPRRSFSTLLKSIEYNIFLVVILIYFVTKKKKSKKDMVKK